MASSGSFGAAPSTEVLQICKRWESLVVSVFVWSFVWEFLYHLMPSFVQQIPWNWLSKQSQPTCPGCLWFVPVEHWMSRGFPERLPCQSAPRLHQRKANSSTAVMGQAVFGGLHSFNTRGKESGPALQEHLIPTHTRGLAQGQDVTRKADGDASFSLRYCEQNIAHRTCRQKSSWLSLRPCSAVAANYDET